MRRALLGILLLTPLAACTGGSVTTEDQSYTINAAITALVVDARAAAVTVESGTGAATVTETHRYADSKPQTTHTVDGSTLKLTEAGCGNDEVRCDVEYRIVVPAAASAHITAQAGAVGIAGLSGDVTVTTQAGAVEGKALAGDTVSVTTQAGATKLAFIEAPTKVTTSTELGAVELMVPGDVAYAVDVQTRVGKSDVSVRRDAASPHRIEVRTQVGAVRIAPVAS